MAVETDDSSFHSVDQAVETDDSSFHSVDQGDGGAAPTAETVPLPKLRSGSAQKGKTTTCLDDVSNVGDMFNSVCERKSEALLIQEPVQDIDHTCSMGERIASESFDQDLHKLDSESSTEGQSTSEKHDYESIDESRQSDQSQSALVDEVILDSTQLVHVEDHEIVRDGCKDSEQGRILSVKPRRGHEDSISEMVLEVHKETGCYISKLNRLHRSGLLQKLPRNHAGVLMSVGSLKHQVNSCTPCVFFPRKTCWRSILCTNCHLDHCNRKISLKRAHPKDRNVPVRQPSEVPGWLQTPVRLSAASPPEALGSDMWRSGFWEGAGLYVLGQGYPQPDQACHQDDGHVRFADGTSPRAEPFDRQPGVHCRAMPEELAAPLALQVAQWDGDADLESNKGCGHSIDNENESFYQGSSSASMAWLSLADGPVMRL